MEITRALIIQVSFIIKKEMISEFLSDLKTVFTEVTDSSNSGKRNAQCEEHCLVIYITDN